MHPLNGPPEERWIISLMMLRTQVSLERCFSVERRPIHEAINKIVFHHRTKRPSSVSSLNIMIFSKP
jgi:hypothetical protein